MNRYKKEKIIGSGQFGHVYLVKSDLSRHAYVLKEINFSRCNSNEQTQALNEVSILSKFKHKNIIRYKEAFLEPAMQTLSVVMEYAEGGDLYSAILNQKGIFFSEYRILTWFIQICLALQHIHFQNILHRDLKTQNIFLTRNAIIKVGDFGIARMLKGKDDLAKTSVGTPFYLSPEIYKRQTYNQKSDMWALGCVLFEMAALEHPFKANDIGTLAAMVTEGMRRDFPDCCCDTIKEMVNDLLVVDPEKRPLIEDIISRPSLQPYLTEYMDKQQNFGRIPLLSTQYIVGRNNSEEISNHQDNRRSHLKRSFTVSETNPSFNKQRTEPRRKEHDPSPAKNLLPKVLPRAKYRPEPVHLKVDSAGSEDSPKSPRTYFDKQSHLAKSMDAYRLPKLVQHCRIAHSDSEDNLLRESDGGYRSGSSSCGQSSARTESQPKGSKSESKLRYEIKIGIEIDQEQVAEARSSSQQSQCPHPQCHQCVLEQLRSVSTLALDSDGYRKIKDELLKTFDPHVFQKVHRSLLNDFKQNKKVTDGNYFCLANVLEYGQIQSLPLMMQLVHLDIRRR